MSQCQMSLFSILKKLDILILTKNLTAGAFCGLGLNEIFSNAPGGAKICGKLFKEKFANGTKGKCIEFENRMLTPFEFEKACNLGNSRDWRRSIHFAGDHIKVLIKCKILLVHAQVVNL